MVQSTDARQTRPRLSVVVEPVNEPVDIDGWADELVALAMDVEGMKPRAGAARVREVG